MTQESEGGEQQEFMEEGTAILRKLQSLVEQWELQRLLGGPYDQNGATLTIQVRGPFCEHV